MDYFLLALKKYAVFTGRARRKEYWMFALFSFIFAIAATIADKVLGTAGNDGSGAISELFSLAMLIPSLAVGVRRLHDVGKSGWFTLIIFIPLVGVIWLLVLDCTEGSQGDNLYGSDPKAADLAY
ncbi:DUF805 domain-containing protein [Hymenobacter negativus]|uniref:DUF805 domain-containing protein n=1 Tax=Hymenobacter negativus TaxID=2795026 RepID=A0ABS3QGS0_9BACT|nr:DUF805 domain-containing protein [Hymenobacter negativus]MBO2009925.1 DUF805 domain-containing protein [Hymenobacter negativus]